MWWVYSHVRITHCARTFPLNLMIVLGIAGVFLGRLPRATRPQGFWRKQQLPLPRQFLPVEAARLSNSTCWCLVRDGRDEEAHGGETDPTPSHETVVSNIWFGSVAGKPFLRGRSKYQKIHFGERGEMDGGPGGRQGVGKPSALGYGWGHKHEQHPPLQLRLMGWGDSAALCLSEECSVWAPCKQQPGRLAQSPHHR